MKKCIVIPDSFKGTLSAEEVCEIIGGKIKEFYPMCQVQKIPVADGGEGTTDCFLYALGADKVEMIAHNAYMEEIPVYYARKGDMAIIEMAQAAGLPQVEGRENPKVTTTFGVGEMILHAIEHGCDNIVVGLGGSCSNDGGCGMAAALGVKFLDDERKELLPTGGTLHKIKSVDLSLVRERLQGITIRGMCDIDNPLCGPRGAAVVFAPQKGADEEMVKELDQNLEYLGKYLEKLLGVPVIDVSGAGAAGGMGAGIAAFTGGSLVSGIDMVLDLVKFDESLENTELVITGEGRIDSQSLGGKAIIGISKRAKKKNIPVLAVVGSIGDGAEKAYDMGVTSIFSINRQAQDFQVSRYASRENLAATMESILRFHKACN